MKEMTEQAKPSLWIWLSLGIVFIGQVGTSGENIFLGMVGQQIMDTFHVNMVWIQIINLIFPLGTGCLSITTALFGHLYGWKRLFISGIFIIGSGEIITGLAPNILIFTLAGRITVALGASMIVPSFIAIVAALFAQPKYMAIAYGFLAGAAGFATCVLPIILGSLDHVIGWNFGFVIFGVLFIMDGFLAMKILPPLRNAHKQLRFSWGSIVLSVISIALFLFTLSQTYNWGLIMATHAAPFSIFGTSPIPYMLVLSIGLFVYLLRHEAFIEKKGKKPLLPVKMVFSRGLLASLCLNLSYFGSSGIFVILFTPYFLVVQGLSVFQASLHALAYTLPVFFGSLFWGKYHLGLSIRHLCQLLYSGALLGEILIILGLTSSGYSPLAYMGLIILGFSLGGILSQTSFVAGACLPTEYAKQSGGIQASTRNTGEAFSIALVGAFLMGVVHLSFVHQTASMTENQPYQIALFQKVNFSNDRIFQSMLNTIHVPKKQQIQMIPIFHNSRLLAARICILVWAIILFFLMWGTFLIPKQLRV